MKYVILSIALLSFMSCTKPSNEVISEWKIIAYYGDPGDGSGDFIPVDSDKEFIFYDDGTCEVKNGSLCDLGAESGTLIGTYDEASKVITADCSFTSNITHRYEINSDNELLIYYPCIEPCVEKYESK